MFIIQPSMRLASVHTRSAGSAEATILCNGQTNVVLMEGLQHLTRDKD
jgi:hypothetical protein